MAIKKWILQNWFLLGLVGAAFLAWLTPGLGAAGGVFRSEVTTRLGVVLIFFFQGLTLSLAVLQKGFMQWKLHVFAQVYIFLVVPLLALGMIDRRPVACGYQA